MSFQDVGRPSKGRSFKQPAVSRINETNDANQSEDLTNAHNEASDNILQYQRNVALLENVASDFRNKPQDAVARAQYNVQVDVVKQLGGKIEGILENLEENLATLSRTDAARSRAALVKLTRDFRRVEQKSKQVQLELRKAERAEPNKWNFGAEDRRNEEQTAGYDQTAMQLQAQLQEDMLNQQIMREREEEIRNINQGMHQVNEIYKDLANIVASQQEHIDEVETHMEEANANAEAGLKNVEKANQNMASPSCLIS